MQWQDIVFTAGSVVFIIALLPSVFSENKPDIKTSLMTAGILTIFGFTYASLKLYFSAAVTIVTALVWGYLAWQKKHKK